MGVGDISQLVTYLEHLSSISGIYVYFSFKVDMVVVILVLGWEGSSPEGKPCLLDELPQARKTPCLKTCVDHIGKQHSSVNSCLNMHACEHTCSLKQEHLPGAFKKRIFQFL